MTNHIKARIDKTQLNSRWWLYGDKDETINYMSECSKLAQKKFKTRHDWVGKVIHWELCKKMKFDHTNKWYIHNSESVLENETFKLCWDFEIQTSHLISARRPDFIIINNKERELAKLWTLLSQLTTVKLKISEKKDKNLDLLGNWKKTWNKKVTFIPIIIGALDSVTEGSLKGLKDSEIRGRVKTIWTKALLKSARILRRVLETRGDLLSLKVKWKTIS